MSAVEAPTGGGALELREVSKRFGRQEVLRCLSLTVPTGSLTAILGPSGSGKTTLLRVVAGFERAHSGSVTIGGAAVDDDTTYVPPEQRRMGYVPQEGGLFPHLTVGRNVAFGLRRSDRRRERVAELLTMVGMEGTGHRYPHQLSGGQQQRVALARALAVEPALVLLDEPFSSLDAALRASVRAEVREVLQSAGATALLVTHDQDEALSWADHVAVLRDGRIGQLDTPQLLYTRPTDPVLACFVGDANLLSGSAVAGGVRTALGVHAVAGTPPAAGTAVTVLVRPEQVELVGEPSGAPATGRVVEYQYFGHDAVVRVALDEGVTGAEGMSLLVARVMGGSRWAPGTPVGLSVRGAVLVWPRDPMAAAHGPS